MTTSPVLDMVEIAVTDITPNPRQPRQAFDPAALQELAASIQAHGLQQPLIVEPNGQGYHLIAGERRWRAAQIAGLTAVPCLVRRDIVDDRQRLELALIENVQREDLSPAEEARAYQQLHAEFHLTDEQIARQVGKARVTITNTRNLTKLPAKVQTLIGSGSDQLPMRYARSLVPIAKAVPEKKLVEAAQSIIQATTDTEAEGWQQDPEAVIDDLVGKLTVEVQRDLWKLDWPAQPIATTDQAGTLEMPACKDCPFFLETVRRCANLRCHAAKLSAWTALELERVSQKFKIPVVAPGESFTVIDIRWDLSATINAWLKKPPAHLRLTGPVEFKGSLWEHKHKLGSAVVFLATIDPASVTKPQATPAAKTIVPADESEAAKAKRLAAEERERAKRREQKAALRKARYDVAWLIEKAAHLIAGKLTISGGVLKFTAGFVVAKTQLSLQDWPEMSDILTANSRDLSEAGYRQCIALQRATHAVIGGKFQIDFNFSHAVDRLETLAQKVFEVSLPKNWSEPPIHHTASNCWHCGKFTSTAEITQRDRTAGWGVKQVGAELKEVYCPECSKPIRAKVQAASKPRSTGPSKPAPTQSAPGKPSTAKPKAPHGKPAKK